MKLSGFGAEHADDVLVLDPMRPIIDAHHHLWPEDGPFDYARAGFGADLASGHNIVATVFVECMASYRTDGDPAMAPVGETEFIVGNYFAPARPGRAPYVGAGIIAWADLGRPGDAARTLAGHIEAGGSRLSGVRHNAVWHERAGLAGVRPYPRHLLLDPSFRVGLAEVSRLGLTYDVWITDGQLPELCALADTLPDLAIVLNHFGGPITHDATKEGRFEIFDRWRDALREAAKRPNLRLKLGGMGMTNYAFGFERRLHRTGSVELAAAWKPYFEVASDAFGARRCMFESNFPVDKQSFSYRAVWNAFKLLAAGVSEQERHCLFYGTAKNTYRLDLPEP